MNPLSLAFEESGSGRAVVCLHGFGESRYTWREVRDTIARTHRYIGIDLKGFGNSVKPDDGRYAMRDQAALVRQLLQDLHIDDVILVGHSFGGGVALTLALDLIATSGITLSGLMLIGAASYRQPLPLFISVLRLPVIGPLLQHLVPARMQVRSVLRLAYHDPSLIPDASIEAYAAPLAQPGGREALRATALQIIPDDVDETSAKYPTIAVPTLLLWGRHDAIVPVTIGERLRAALPHATLVIVEGAGHIPHEETPDAAREEIARYLSVY